MGPCDYCPGDRDDPIPAEQRAFVGVGTVTTATESLVGELPILQPGGPGAAGDVCAARPIPDGDGLPASNAIPNAAATGDGACAAVPVIGRMSRCSDGDSIADEYATADLHDGAFAYAIPNTDGTTNLNTLAHAATANGRVRCEPRESFQS